jgi:hypothetical protein
MEDLESEEVVVSLMITPILVKLPFPFRLGRSPHSGSPHLPESSKQVDRDSRTA